MEESKTNEKKKGNNLLIIILAIAVIILVVILVITNKSGKTETHVKSSLDKLVEKSNLETVDITYNVIAKKCKDDANCDLKSNNIDDFKYVVSCKGIVTAGIDFKNIKIEDDSKNKKIVITLPEAAITNEPTIKSMVFLNGEEIPADELPNARKLCQETTKTKSDEDGKLLETAKEQARVVLENYYQQWIKTYDSSYDVEIK